MGLCDYNNDDDDDDPPTAGHRCSGDSRDSRPLNPRTLSLPPPLSCYHRRTSTDCFINSRSGRSLSQKVEQFGGNVLGCELYDASNLRKVTHMMDVDGFNVSGVFHAKEICILNVTTNEAVRIDVRLPRKYAELSPNEKSTVSTITHNIHGMYWNNRLDRNGRKCFRRLVAPERLPTLLSEYFRKFAAETAANGRNWTSTVTAAMTNDGHDKSNILVAYKGGVHERTLLDKIGIRSLNIELYGCPPFDYLVRQFPDVYDPSKYFMCNSSYGLLIDNPQIGFICDTHKSKSNGKKWHCPIEECRVFAIWMNLAIRSCQFGSTNANVIACRQISS